MIATALTGQMATGAILGVVWRCRHSSPTTMPAVGRGVVDVARHLADLELSNAASTAPRRRVRAGQRLERTRAEVRFGIVS
jgi:hypothetical protein